MIQTKEQFIKSMLNKKAKESNTIDLNAYASGLEDMHKVLNITFVSKRSELLIACEKELLTRISGNGLGISRFMKWLEGSL